MQSDMMFCKDQAKTESESGGNQVAEFLLGFTIIGYPIGRQHNIDNQRAFYQKCMEDRGYAYTPPGRRSGFWCPSASPIISGHGIGKGWLVQDHASGRLGANRTERVSRSIDPVGREESRG
jgi:hypothetical protein